MARQWRAGISIRAAGAQVSIDASRNFRRVSDTLTTSGTVEAAELRRLSAAGYEAVVNLLPDTSEFAVASEREIVESQGLDYLHIPVDFAQPTAADFDAFCAALDGLQDRKVHVHCAANYRVSLFYALYAVARGRWSPARACAFVADVWQPHRYPGWARFAARLDAIEGDGHTPAS
jgi:uncharacterized protein (TIGR01244 family)